MTTRLAYTRQEAAEVMGVKLDTIRRAINSGKLRAKKTGSGGGGNYLISEDQLRAWFETLEDA